MKASTLFCKSPCPYGNRGSEIGPSDWILLSQGLVLIFSTSKGLFEMDSKEQGVWDDICLEPLFYNCISPVSFHWGYNLVKLFHVISRAIWIHHVDAVKAAYTSLMSNRVKILQKEKILSNSKMVVKSKQKFDPFLYKSEFGFTRNDVTKTWVRDRHEQEHATHDPF